MPRSQYYRYQYFGQQRRLQYNNILKYCYYFVLMSNPTHNHQETCKKATVCIGTIDCRLLVTLEHAQLAMCKLCATWMFHQIFQNII